MASRKNSNLEVVTSFLKFVLLFLALCVILVVEYRDQVEEMLLKFQLLETKQQEKKTPVPLTVDDERITVSSVEELLSHLKGDDKRVVWSKESYNQLLRHLTKSATEISHLEEKIQELNENKDLTVKDVKEKKFQFIIDDRTVEISSIEELVPYLKGDKRVIWSQDAYGDLQGYNEEKRQKIFDLEEKIESLEKKQQKSSDLDNQTVDGQEISQREIISEEEFQEFQEYDEMNGDEVESIHKKNSWHCSFHEQCGREDCMSNDCQYVPQNNK